MPIPPFDGVLNVLPPHLGDPRVRADMAPYACTVEELCDRFATTLARKRILEEFLRFRTELFSLGIRGFQWLDGSLLEDIETQEGRDPRDIDAITFVADPADPSDLFNAIAPNPNLLNHAFVKTTYLTDHFWVPLGSAPAEIVDLSRVRSLQLP